MSHRSSKTSHQSSTTARAHRRQAPEVCRPLHRLLGAVAVNRLQPPKAFLKMSIPIKKQVAKLGTQAERPV
ncbi:BQ5605_C033g11214 [Microbotryum silenes-dioicae]|uniref:BQ5605_C033g11214 protein n=1 Tax=Microbotryum silenes-dioicae TaxID=796604 RepID=A0A2X0MKI8_9BASI|nr:BQ5605_C033g11214 [Microbotryum silenes-dioicae]